MRLKILPVPHRPIDSPAVTDPKYPASAPYLCHQIMTTKMKVKIVNQSHHPLPEGYEAQMRPRSGLALRHGITMLNSPGTIDADYRGELQIVLVNLSDTPFTVRDGERIGQIVVARVEHVEWQPVSALDETERGSGGFGHTGI